MTRYSFYEKRSGKIIFGCAWFLLLLMARDTLITSCILGFPLSQFTGLGIMVLLGILFLVWNRNNIKEILRDRRTICVGIAAVMVLLPMLVKHDWGYLLYFSVLLCLFFGIFLSYFISVEQVAKHYVVMLSVLAVYSLVATYILKPMVEMGEFSVPTFTNIAGAVFYDFKLSFVYAESNYYRNFGIFREPGVYQFFIIVALYLNHYTVIWKRQWPMWLIDIILTVTMFSTFYTVGVVAVLLFAVVVFFDKKLYKNKFIAAAAILAIVAVAIVVGVIIVKNEGIYWTIYSMLRKLLVWDISSNVRIDAIVTDVIIFFQNPIFGAGISEVMGAVAHNTTSTMLLFCILGILGGLVSVICWIALVWDKKRSILTNSMLLIILFMSFNTQDLIADVFFWVFPLMAFVQRVLPYVNISRPCIGKKSNKNLDL